MHTTTAIQPSPQLLSFAERHVKSATLHAPKFERRREPRQYFAAPAVVQPVDGKLRPLGNPFATVTRDFSLNGMGLILDELPQQDLFAVQFAVDGQESCLLVEPLWHAPMGPFEHVGFRVLKVLGSMPTCPVKDQSQA